MKLEGIHHVTAITGDAPRQRRLLRPRARAAPREEDGQPGRPDRLPPLLRRREGQRRRGHHLLRVPGRAARPGRRRHGAPDRLARRLRGGARLLGRAARRRGRRDRARTATACASPIPRASGSSCASVETARRAARRRAPGDPGRARAPGLRRRARLLARPGAEPAASSRRRSASRRAATRTWEVRGEPARRLLRLRRAAGRARHPRRRAPCTTSPGRRRWTSTRRGAGARSPAGAHADAGDRPLLLPLDLLPRAERRAVRDRHDRARASPTDEPLEHLGERALAAARLRASARAGSSRC